MTSLKQLGLIESLDDVEIQDERGKHLTSEDQEPTEPDEDDYYITPVGHLGSQTGLYEVGRGELKVFSTDEEAITHARDLMRQHRFYPNLWHLSDHGNWSLIEED